MESVLLKLESTHLSCLVTWSWPRI